MIVAVLDDLMFSSKIKTAASQLAVTVVFARSPASALAEMRKSPPTLVILDLNNPRTNPLGIVAAMKQDPALAGWGDAAVIVPSVLHERFGDAGVLEQQFQSMRSWVDKVSSLTQASGVWSGGFQ